MTPDEHIEQLREFLTGAYGLRPLPGKPEEFKLPGTTHGVSIGYGCGTVRVRLMDGRQWLANFDRPVGVLGLDELAEILDAFFEAGGRK